MTYTVIITPTAETEALEAFEYAPQSATRWLRGLYAAIGKLEDFPEYSRAPESQFLECDLRHIRFKSHRIIFSVDKKARRVYVHYVHHGSRRAIGEPEENDDID